MNNINSCKDKCEFKVNPCNLKIEIKEIKPFSVSACTPLILDLKVISNCNVNNCITLKSKPINGNLSVSDSSIYIYISKKGFYGFDFFQVEVKNELGEKCTETILIHVTN